MSANRLLMAVEERVRNLEKENQQLRDALERSDRTVTWPSHLFNCWLTRYTPRSGVCDERSDDELLAEVELLRADRDALAEALERIAAPGCEIIHGGYPRGFTCLDKQEDARNPESRYTDSFRTAILSVTYPCLPCQARAVLAVHGSGEEPGA